jgi:hypothetical protein
VSITFTDQKSHPSIPRVLCPRCGTLMRLATVEPEQTENRERMTFACDCGFDYRQSHAVFIERTM